MNTNNGRYTGAIIIVVGAAISKLLPLAIDSVEYAKSFLVSLAFGVGLAVGSVMGRGVASLRGAMHIGLLIVVYLIMFDWRISLVAAVGGAVGILYAFISVKDK